MKRRRWEENRLHKSWNSHLRREFCPIQMKQFDWNAWVGFLFFFFPFFFWKINTRSVLNIPRHRSRVQEAFALKGLHRHISSLEFVPVPLGLTFQKSLPIKNWVEELYKQKIKHFIKKKLKEYLLFLKEQQSTAKDTDMTKTRGNGFFYSETTLFFVNLFSTYTEHQGILLV